MSKVDEARSILAALEMPAEQQNERSAYCLLALLNVKPNTAWKDAHSPLIGITPMMDFARDNYGTTYAPNTRETFRRQTMHQFCDAALAVYNPDDPKRPVNSPKAVYQIEPSALALIRVFGTKDWDASLKTYLAGRKSLIEKYAKHREINMIPVKIKDGKSIQLSPGDHSKLIAGIVEQFAPRFAPGADLVYAGDTGDKVGFFDSALLEKLGVKVDKHGKMPDAVLYFGERDWLLLVEAVTSHGPVDGKRHEELAKLFGSAKPGLVYVTAFPDRTTFAKYAPSIAWETEVWIADHPTHLIHFNGSRFLGPYEAS